jgi:hypothetical protein
MRYDALMGRPNRRLLVLCLLVLCVAVCAMWLRSSRLPREVHPLTLNMRQDNGPYGGAAYSFRQKSSDAAVHKNSADLVFNGCGHLHVSPVSNNESRICDLGKLALADAPDAPPDGARWYSESIRPAPGHVYLLDIRDTGQTMTVKFSADAVTSSAVNLTWTVVAPLDGPATAANRAYAGTMGQCGGGPHADE